MQDYFQQIQYFLSMHASLAPFFYVFLHIFLAVFLLPCSPMTVMAGLLWGKWLGLFFSILGALCSSSVTFGLARYFLKRRMYLFFSRRYPKIIQLLEKTKKHGWKLIASVQLNPMAPASTLGYIFGLTKINFWVYLFFSAGFMIPLQITLVMLGDSFSKAFSLYSLGILILTIFVFFMYSVGFRKLKLKI